VPLKDPVSLCIAHLLRDLRYADKRVPFWQSVRISKRAAIAAFLTTTAFISLVVLAASRATPPTPKFLLLDEGQREWWYLGAFMTVSHLVALNDKDKGDCAANWYLKADKEGKAAKRALIEKTLAENPQVGETTVVLSLLTQACGPLVFTPSRNHVR
jgi:hypothetical protein